MSFSYSYLESSLSNKINHCHLIVICIKQIRTCQIRPIRGHLSRVTWSLNWIRIPHGFEVRPIQKRTSPKCPNQNEHDHFIFLFFFFWFEQPMKIVIRHLCFVDNKDQNFPKKKPRKHFFLNSQNSDLRTYSFLFDGSLHSVVNFAKLETPEA